MDKTNTAVLLSIRPHWCEKIIDGLKTIEVRKTKPKLQTPFPCLIYCTKPKFEAEDFFLTPNLKQIMGGGKVIGEFICDKIYDISLYKVTAESVPLGKDIIKEACLTFAELSDYLMRGYGWHISELVIYDEPKELTDFGLTRPPQSWCYVEAD